MSENNTDTEEKEQKEETRGPGQPTLYREIYTEQAYKLALLGATDKEMADFFGVTETTVNNWKIAVPEFFESIKNGKIKADTEVAEKLYHRAKGYSHKETKCFLHEGKVVTHEVTKHYPPDTGAMAFWLKNRQPKKFRDSHDFTSGGEKITPQIVGFGEVIKPQETKEQPSDQTDDNSE